jgi:TonB-dependent receptor
LGKKNSLALRLLTGAALAVVIGAPGYAAAQDFAASDEGEVVVVRGIRGALMQSMAIKREAHGVVDAISAEDIGDFPDTNLAESLQRIPGVSIDRSNGEGSSVTVRGWGPGYNLVTLNGRQMPTSTLGDGASAPSSRSFDFGNLASENIAGVEVYKTGRASVPSGGIGSSINIRTARPFDNPGLQGGFSAKGVLDFSRNDDASLTPEISGIYSDTFADDRIGIGVSGSYQSREASVNNAGVGWREGFRGDENNWGTIPQTGTPGSERITNRPEGADVYSTPQNADYSLSDIHRERINGQAVLQFRPVDSVTATIDYTYSQNEVEVRNNSAGVWFILGNSTSAWGDGPIAEPLFYSEDVSGGGAGGKDLAMSGSLTNNRSINRSLGFNLQWDATDRLSLFADFHHSSAESAPNNPYGSNMSLGTAVFDVDQQSIDFTNEIPVISYNYLGGIPYQDAAFRLPTGFAFRTAYQRSEIDEIRLGGSFDADWGIIESLDFGVNRIENNVRSAFGVLQRDSWGGINGDSADARAQTAADLPDDIFEWVTLPDKFDGLSGSEDPSMMQGFYTFNFERMAAHIDDLYGACGGDGNCLTDFTTDRRIQEDSTAAYLQMNGRFHVGDMPANVVAGVRYEETEISSSALIPAVEDRTAWVAANEFNIFNIPGESTFTTLEGSYEYWLPSVDFDVEVIDNVKLRASASRTLTRPTYDNMQGGIGIGLLFREGQGSASSGNPGLLPNVSTNYDLSAEWYYDDASYIAVGYFRKDVENFISSQTVNTTLLGLRHPGNGPRADQARAALGTDDPVAVRNYMIANFPEDVEVVDGITRIYSRDDDPFIDFVLTQPANSDQTATVDGWEFAIQHDFGDTGFGAVANYTLVSGDLNFDNTQSHLVSQFALTGLSNSANVIGFYDKNGIQARVAYNWRDEFYTGGDRDPFYVEAYGQVDVSASYELQERLTLFLEGINVTGEGRRGHRRSVNEVTFVQPGEARWAGGVRYTF